MEYQKFPWSESGKELLEKIEDTIAITGGRWLMGRIITNQESPELFSLEIRRIFRTRCGSAEWQHKKFYLRRIRWEPQELEDLYTYWERWSIKRIADYIGKTPKAVREHAKAVMSKQKYEDRFYNRKNKIQKTTTETLKDK